MDTLSGAAGGDRIGGEAQASLVDTVSALTAQLGAALRRQQASRVRGLYVIIDPQVTNGREPMEIAEAAVRGGARMLQLRDKRRDKGEVLPLALGVQSLCQANDVDLIVNDHADLAAVVGSAGLHVGQTDLPVAQARRVLSPEQVIGRSNHEFAELEESEQMGADHVAFGAIYATGTKGVGRPPQGVEQLRRAREVTQLPLVAIGGINAENVAPVVEAGADAICVTAAVGLATEPEAAAARLVQAIRGAGGRT
jgi:thiamine-phosphate diphosphorylase